MKKYMPFLCLCFALLLLVACGSDDTNSPSPGDQDQASETDSSVPLVDGDVETEDEEQSESAALTLCTPTPDALCFETDSDTLAGTNSYVLNEHIPSGCRLVGDVLDVQMYETSTSQTSFTVRLGEYTGAGDYNQSSQSVSLVWSVENETETINYQSLSCIVTVESGAFKGHFENCAFENMNDPDMDFKISGAWNCTEVN